MVAPDTTRMLVLGVAQIFEPANGYQLRRELISWKVEAWANVKPGSIYSMLATLTRQEMLRRSDLATAPGTRPIAVYTTTETGRQELVRLVRNGLTTLEVFDQTGFYAALSIMFGLLTRHEVLELLAVRQDALVRERNEISSMIREVEEDKSAPPHVAHLLGFSVTLRAAEEQWLQEFSAMVQSGQLVFVGEDGSESWKPLPDDPAWRMVGEREVYLEQLGGNSA